MTRPFVFAVCGWKNSGKTTLVTRLVAHFVEQGLAVGTIKNAHHAASIDIPGSDTARHREAGAQSVVLLSGGLMARIDRLNDRDAKPDPMAIAASMAECDLVICEGFKRSTLPKVEILGDDSSQEVLAVTDSSVFAIACDRAAIDVRQPVFARNDIKGLAACILARRDEGP